jgi:hypothetical protein
LEIVGVAIIQYKALLSVAVAFWYVPKDNGRAEKLATMLSEGGIKLHFGVPASQWARCPCRHSSLCNFCYYIHFEV